MRFAPEATTPDLPRFIRVFTDIIGREPWLSRYRSLQQQVHGNSLLDPYVRDRHALELAFGALLTLQDERGFLRLSDFTDEHYNLVSLIVPTAMIYEGLNETGKTRLAGMLRDGLNTDKGLRPLQNEIETVTHLLRQNFDVECVDLETGGGFDFLATRDGVEVEIECKSASGDLGRKIHRRDMIRLSHRVHPAVGRALDTTTGGRFIRVQVPDRLGPEARQLDEVANAIEHALAGEESTEGPDPCSVSVEPFDLAPTPLAGAELTGDLGEWIASFVEQRTGSPSHHMFFVFRPGRVAMLILVESRKRDRVLRGLMDDLKAASKAQFTKHRPGILVVQFLELSADELLGVAAQDSKDPREAPAIQIASNRFFRNPERNHILRLIYRSTGTVRRSATIRGDVVERTLAAQGPTYSFRNPNHPLAGDPRYASF